MSFPYYIHIGSISLHPHLVFEFLAYTIGFQYYLRHRDKSALPFQTAIWVIVGATIGAVVGSKILFYFENPPLTLKYITNFAYLIGGKTIVGGLLGGLIGVEIAKKKLGWTRRTGDNFVMPLIIGMSIGRIGCFLTGLDDDTCGKPTTWFTGVNFGDGIPRHPTQLYEIAFLILLGILLFAIKRRRSLPTSSMMPEGAQFQMFMVGYLLFRLMIDFIKPVTQIVFGLGSIQIACIFGLIYFLKFIPSWFQTSQPNPEPSSIPTTFDTATFDTPTLDTPT